VSTCDYETLRIDIQTLLDDLGIDWLDLLRAIALVKIVDGGAGGLPVHTS
jgi:hypothetical protein